MVAEVKFDSGRSDADQPMAVSPTAGFACRTTWQVAVPWAEAYPKPRAIWFRRWPSADRYRDEARLVFLSRFGGLARALIERREYVTLNILQNLVRKRWRSLRDSP